MKFRHSCVNSGVFFLGKTSTIHKLNLILVCFSLGKQARFTNWTSVPECPCEKFMNWPFLWFGLPGRLLKSGCSGGCPPRCSGKPRGTPARAPQFPRLSVVYFSFRNNFWMECNTRKFRSRPGKPNQRKGQNEKFMNFAHFCEFWCFSLGKQARFTLNFCSGMPPGKVHELPRGPCEASWCLAAKIDSPLSRGNFWLSTTLAQIVS